MAESYQLTLITKSFLLNGSGEGSTLINADVVFLRSGFPFIPARRVKGMLKESLEEVLEIYGKKEEEKMEVIQSLFGVSGKAVSEGKLVFHNMFLEGWHKMEEERRQLPANTPWLNVDFVKSHFTSEIQQTAIDEDGTAKDRSLRNYRVLQPGLTFEGLITSSRGLSNDEQSYLQEAVANWRYAGTRRNRGFGKIICTLGPKQIVDPGNQNEPAPSFHTNTEEIRVEVKTLSPVVLALRLGDQNTVYTQRHIAGNQVRGMLAGEFIRANNRLERSNAHSDTDFYDCFLSGKLQFGPLTYTDSSPTPFYIQEYKGRNDLPLTSIFHPPPEGQEKLATRRVNYFSIRTDGKIKKCEPSTTFFFHNSRENRRAGRSTDDQIEGGIFYYEALDAGQTFSGFLTGDGHTLEKLKDAFPLPIRTRMGRSKTAQYGLVEVRLIPTADHRGTTVPSPLSVKEYILDLESPLLLYNKEGFPQANATLLSSYLATKLHLAEEDIEVKTAESKVTYIEQYNSTWMSKSGKMVAFKEGSSFLIRLKTGTTSPPPSYLGELQEQGFGKVTFTPFEDSHNQFTRENREHPTGDPAPSPQQELQSDRLIEIKERFEREQKELKVMTKAMESAEKTGGQKLKNHLIGRMELLFERSDEKKDITGWMKEAQGQPVIDALKGVGIVNEDGVFQFVYPHDFMLEKLYWRTFFQMLRKLNKGSNG